MMWTYKNFLTFKLSYIYFFSGRLLPMHYLARHTHIFELKNFSSKHDLTITDAWSSTNNFNFNFIFSVRRTLKYFKRFNINSFTTFLGFKKKKIRFFSLFFKKLQHYPWHYFIKFFCFTLEKTLMFVLPFLPLILLRSCINNSFFYVNFQSVKNPYYFLKVGDFITYAYSTVLFNKFKFFLKKQVYINRRLRNKIFNIKLRQDSYKPLFNTTQLFSVKFYMRTAVRYKPLWLEIDFLSFSIFIISQPTWNYTFFFFNPFLYKLILFR